ncbi:MAG: hypothetical protein QOG23_4631 [Blastocatellia bacterium]|jgi:hypothetical protein|nr:hypothetical protein [Blastocatellia bacterium]
MKKRLIGQCIYCGTTAGRLQDEHTVPYGFNGGSILLKASCKKCADITSAFETVVLRDTLSAGRAAVGAKTRHRKQREKDLPMYVVRNGKEEEIRAPWQAHWKVMPLPVFEPPAFLDGRDYKGGVEAHRLDITWVGEGPQEIAKIHGADDVAFKLSNPMKVASSFAKLVAKIGYGTVIMNFGLAAIEEAFVVPAILGKRDDIGRWVGCDGQRIMGKEYNLWSTRIEVLRGLFLARVKLFAKADGTEYLIVVGRASEGLRGLLHSVGHTDS